MVFSGMTMNVAIWINYTGWIRRYTYTYSNEIGSWQTECSTCTNQRA